MAGVYGGFFYDLVSKKKVNIRLSAGTPIRIIGFDPKYRNVFRNVFKIPESDYCENVDFISKEERPDLREWVPTDYRNLKI